MAENILDKTIDNGVIENVQIAPIGKFIGSSTDGSPVEENITVDKLEQLADKLNKSDDILCDVDHASCKNGVDKNSKAAGWFTRFVLDPIKGLFATLSLTKYGRELLENREYRYTSPVFTLNDDGTVADLHSVALTNQPAFKGHIQPILNQESNEILKDKECLNEDTKDILTMDITREELKEMISSIISDMRAAEKAQEIQREVVEEVVENECSTGTTKEEVVKNETSEEEVVKASEEATTTEKSSATEEVVPEEKVEEKKEVIKLETLNSAPTLKDIEPEWKRLTGQEFLDWAAKNPNYQI